VLGPGQERVTGDLTLHGQTHPVTFELETTEPINDPFGFVRAGAAASGKSSREEWGLTWNKHMETGSLMVGDKVKIPLAIQGVTKPAILQGVTQPAVAAAAAWN
jgi:polyisoprenoid-binding protein YceI